MYIGLQLYIQKKFISPPTNEGAGRRRPVSIVFKFFFYMTNKYPSHELIIFFYFSLSWLELCMVNSIKSLSNNLIKNIM